MNSNTEIYNTKPEDIMTTNPQSELRKQISILVHSWFAVDYSGGDITDKELKLLEDSIYTLLSAKRQEWEQVAYQTGLQQNKIYFNERERLKKEWMEKAILYTLNTIYNDLDHMISTHSGFDKLFDEAIATIENEELRN